MESIEETLHTLKVLLHGYPWFAHHVVKNDNLHNSIIAYVNYMPKEINQLIPQKINDYDVRVHFTNSTCLTKTYVSTVDIFSSLEKVVEDEVEFSSNINLKEELFKLGRICGKNNLETSFYEIHDGDNKITNVLSGFPDVREKLTELYDTYGFDLIYEYFI